MTKNELEQLIQLINEGNFTAFRTGIWTDSDGKIHDITQGDLDHIVNQFTQITKQGKEVPFTIGHPYEHEPGQGKIERVFRFGDYLLAKAKDVKKELADEIKKGLLRFVSIAFNPEFQLQHIGITNNPAVEGLLPITPAFSAFEKEKNILFIFSNTGDIVGIDDLKQPVEFLSQLEPSGESEMATNNETRDNQFTKNIKTIEKEDPMKDVTGAKAPENENVSEDTTAETAKLDTKLAQFEHAKIKAEQKAKQAEQKLAEFHEKIRNNDISAFTKNLLEKKKLYPIEVEPMTLFLSQLDREKTYQFSKDAPLQPPLDFIKAFLEGLPDRLPLNKIKEPGKPTGQDNACFSRIKPDDENMDLHNRAIALMESKNIPYEVALAQLED